MKASTETDPVGTSLVNEDMPSLRFVSTNEDHAFLLQSEHDVSSITYSLFQNKAEEVQQGEEGEGEEKKEKATFYFDNESPDLQKVLEEEDKKD